MYFIPLLQGLDAGAAEVVLVEIVVGLVLAEAGAAEVVLVEIVAGLIALADTDAQKDTASSISSMAPYGAFGGESSGFTQTQPSGKPPYLARPTQIPLVLVLGGAMSGF